MINTALLGRFRIGEFIQFINNTLIIVKRHDPEKLRIKALYLALLRQYEALSAAYKQDNNSQITPLLAALDARRDQAIICLRQLCDGFTHHFDAKKREAGQRIIHCIDKYGSKLYHLNYSAETAALKKLVNDLQTIPECINALQELQLEAVVKEIETANNRFEQTFIQRLEEFSQFEGKTSRELIQLTTEAYRTLIQHVDAHATLAPSEAYSALINHFNKNIEYFNLIAERRKNSGTTEEVDADASLDAPALE